MDLSNELVASFVAERCSKDPALVGPVIAAATRGVKAFARQQSDDSSKMASMLCDILDKVDREQLAKLKFFTGLGIAKQIAPWFKGTQFYRERLVKMYPEIEKP